MACLFPGAPDLGDVLAQHPRQGRTPSDPPPRRGTRTLSTTPGRRTNDRVYCKRGGYLGGRWPRSTRWPTASCRAVGRRRRARPVAGAEGRRARRSPTPATPTARRDPRPAPRSSSARAPTSTAATRSQHGGSCRPDAATASGGCTPSTRRRRSSGCAQDASAALPRFNADTAPGPDPQHHRRAASPTGST